MSLGFLETLGLGAFGKFTDIWSDREAAKDERSFSEAASARQMDFQERMSNTAYQRAVADMKAAGLNPIMAFSQGGASSPSGALATSSQVRSAPFSASLSSAVQVNRMDAEIDLLKSQKAKTDAEAELTRKTMPPADPWRIIYELFGKGAVTSAGDVVRGVGRKLNERFNTAKESAEAQNKSEVKTYPLRDNWLNNSMNVIRHFLKPKR